MNQCGKMKLLLRSLLLSSLCTLSSWSVSSETFVVTQSPDVSVPEGRTVSISCCWRRNHSRVGINWLKNKISIKNETIKIQSQESQNVQTDRCGVLIFQSVTSKDSGRYICRVSVEIPVLNEVEGNGTTITVTARENSTNNLTGDKSPDPAGQQFSVVIALAVVVPLLFIALACFCSLRRKQGQAARVIYEVPHTDSMDAEMDKHSTTSSRGSTQWCQVPVYDSLDYFERVETKESK